MPKVGHILATFECSEQQRRSRTDGFILLSIFFLAVLIHFRPLRLDAVTFEGRPWQQKLDSGPEAKLYFSGEASLSYRNNHLLSWLGPDGELESHQMASFTPLL